MDIFKPSPAIAIPTTSKNGVKRVNTDLIKSNIWDEFNKQTGLNLGNGIGVYIFSIKSSRGEKPWYVGRAEGQTFEKECFSTDKLVKYNHLLYERVQGTPKITLIAKYTPTGRLCKMPKSKLSDPVKFLEAKLISQCLQRNEKLINIKNTKYEKEMTVEGFMNSSSRRTSTEIDAFKKLIGSK